MKTYHFPNETIDKEYSENTKLLRIAPTNAVELGMLSNGIYKPHIHTHTLIDIQIKIPLEINDGNNIQWIVYAIMDPSVRMSFMACYRKHALF